MKVSRLGWYWHRLRAMEPAEIAAHARRKLFQWQDRRSFPDCSGARLQLASSSSFPRPPRAAEAPPAVREALARDRKEILSGRWRAFGHLEVQVDDPPRWHKDYLVGRDLATASESAFTLDHRDLPEGADIKLIWELSRWQQLVRLAMAAYVNGDEPAAGKCIEWLEDWVKHNAPYRGWNWTSALEVGMRLVQFAWIDALLERRTPMSEQGEADFDARTRLSALRQEILPAHVRYAWRYRSFGSSANNHSIGELVGLIVAIARWPELARWATPLDELQKLWEREVLAQFAEDGGNREQALNYHLFAWELCWQARGALVATERKITGEADERLRRAARFYWEVQVRREPWDYGDSDSALAAPLFTREQIALIEWRDWLSGAVSKAGAARDYWLGDPPQLFPPLGRGEPVHATEAADWWIYPATGIAICESGYWWLRWDLSPLGYLKTAAHGHLDALHLSIWFNGVALVVDPGTGAYYADRNLRAWLASRGAHNGPDPRRWKCPGRWGAFLWSSDHRLPRWKTDSEGGLAGEWPLADCPMRRRILPIKNGQGWRVEDSFQFRAGPSEFSVRWQFASGARLEQMSERSFRVKRKGIHLDIEAGEEWAEVHPVVERDSRAVTSAATSEAEARFAGTVSPAFRQVEWAPFLKLVGRPSDKSCVFRTTFLASGDL